jgi:polysaccharide transporter, PST family
MTLIKTSFLNGIAVIVRMLTLLGLNKLLAVYVGPAGFATIGQFQNAMQMITTFASGAVNNGVTKYTAEYYESDELQRRVWRTAGSIALICSILASLLIAIFCKQLANWLLRNESYYSVFLWFSASLTLFVFNALLLAILNGKKEIAIYVIANIAGSIFALIVTSIMAIEHGLYGALVALAVFQSISFFVTLFLCMNAKWFSLSYIIGNIDWNIARNLAKYTLMAITSAICAPLSYIIVRNHLTETFGSASAGYWEAMTRLSSAYLMLITTTLSIYYLPRLSELKEGIEIKKEIINGYRVIMPVVIGCCLLIYLLRDYIIGFLFTNEFYPMRELFAWQMLGDTLKIGSWILSYLMIGKAMFRLFIGTEIVFTIFFVVLSVVLSHAVGLKGVPLAYSLTYLFYWVFLFYMLFLNIVHK